MPPTAPVQTLLLTGATQGIGRAAAEALVSPGRVLVLVARDPARLDGVAQELRRRAPGAVVETLAGDLARVAEVRRVAAEFRARHDRLHVLLNNAGALFARREETPEGRERTFALNHLAYFVLVEELLPVLKASAPARIVNVSSGAHVGGHVDFDDLEFRTRPYRSWSAYAQSKLMNVLFTRELARRLAGTGVTANAMHPGFVKTGFGRNTPGLVKTLVSWSQAFARTPEHGARTLVWLATSPAVEGVSGKYFLDERERGVSAEARDEAVARRLWDVTERLVESARAA